MATTSTLQFRCDPFSTSPDPAFLYQSTEHKTALNRLEINIRLKRGLSLILGDVGTGKTTLSRALMQTFNEEEDYLFHMILDPGYKTEHQLLAHLARLFGVHPFFRSVVDYRDSIEKYLFQKCVEEHKTVVLVIDEGQKLATEQLELLRTLLNYETNEFKMLQLVIFGQMELLPRVKEMNNLLDRISLKYILNPLNEYEVGELIDFRLRQAGYKGTKKLFDLEAIRKIHQYTQGYPRQISMICHRAIEYLIVGDYEVANKELIDKIIVEQRLWT